MLCTQPAEGSDGLQIAGPAPNLLPHSAVAVPPAESLHSLPSSEDDASWQWAPPDGLLDPPTFKFCTALHLAAHYGHVNVLEALQTGAGCDMHARNQQVGFPASKTAQIAQAPKVASFWSHVIAAVSLQLFPVLLNPCCGCQPWQCMQGCTALHMAAHQGHVKAACWLAKPGGVDVDAVDNSGRTALHHAAALGHDGVVQALWARGCSVQAEDVHGWTGAPLLCAASCLLVML